VEFQLHLLVYGVLKYIFELMELSSRFVGLCSCQVDLWVCEVLHYGCEFMDLSSRFVEFVDFELHLWVYGVFFLFLT